MADKKIQLQIITPTGIKVDKPVDMAIIRATTGDMGFLPGHEAYSAILDTGALRILNGDTEEHVAIFGGMAEINDDKLTVVTPLAELPDEIDRQRAEAAMLEAERHLLEGSGEYSDAYSEQVRIRRSMVRLEVSSYPIISTRNDDE